MIFSELAFCLSLHFLNSEENVKIETLPVALPVVWSLLGPVEELVVVPLPLNQSKSSVCKSDQLHLSISKLQLPVKCVIVGLAFRSFVSKTFYKVKLQRL